MKDLAQGSVTKHLLHMSAFLAVSMLVQTLYLLADLYWVGRLGKEAIAAVGVAGNLMMIVLALTQMLGVGTTTLISQAAGKKDQARAVYIIIVYGIIRGFGPAAQAGFGVGARVMQALFLPVVALSFAVAPVVGQNFGGRRGDRVRQSVYSAIGIASVTMLVLTLIAHFAPAPLIGAFSNDPRVIAFGSDYLRIVSFNFVAAGIVFTTSSVFQGIGNTWPPLFSSLTRLVLFVLPAVLVSRTPGFEIKHVWYLSVASIVLQACINLLLLRRELRKKLTFESLENLIPGGATAT